MGKQKELFKLLELEMYKKRVAAIRDLVGILESDFSCFFDRCGEDHNDDYFFATSENLKTSKEYLEKATLHINLIKPL